MNTSTTLSPTTSDPYSYFYKDLVRFLIYNPAYVNIVLGVLVILQNTLIIIHYCLREITFVPGMSLAIAVMDYITAAAEIAKSAAAIAFFKGHVEARVLEWCMIIYQGVGVFAYNCSITYYVILHIIKYKDISRSPYDVATYTKTKVATASLTVLWVVLNIADMYVFITARFAHDRLDIVDNFAQPTTWDYMWELPPAASVGKISLHHIPYCFKEIAYTALIAGTITLTLLQVHYIVPAWTVLIGMSVQMKRIKRRIHDGEIRAKIDQENGVPENKLENSLDEMHEGSTQDGPTSINTTICMIGTLFFVCNSLYTTVYMYGQFPGVMTAKNRRVYLTVQGVTQYTLPLVHALFFPLIIILRKQSLRKQFHNYFRNVWCCLCRRHRTQPGYERLE